MPDEAALAGPPALKSKARSLRSAVLRAGGWTVLGHLSSVVLRLVTSLVMTRLLAPEIFGIMAIAMVIQVVVGLLTDVGISQSIIHSKRGTEPLFLNTAWTIQTVRGALIWGVCLVAAAFIHVTASLGWAPPDSVYADPILPYIVVAASFAAVISGFQSTKMSSANRELNLRRVVLVELCAQVVGVLVVVSMGWWTRSIWAFVVGALTSAAVGVSLSHIWLVGERNRFAWDKSAINEIFGYGRWILYSSVLTVAAMNSDRALIGLWSNAAVLGKYSIALNLASVAESLGLRLFGSVSMPVLSSIARNNPEQFRRQYYRMRTPVDVVFMAMAGFVFAVGPAVIGLLYDDRYQLSGPMLSILSFSLVFSRFSLAHNAYLALGKSEYLTVIALIKLASMLILVPVLYVTHGIMGAVAGVALHAAATLPAVFWFNQKSGLNNLRFEILVLGAWPPGYALGYALANL